MALADPNLTLFFAEALRAAKPNAHVDDLGYATFEDSLIEGAGPELVRRAFPTADGRGRESRQPRLYAANSPLMLAVNVFAPWLKSLESLPVLDMTDFRDMRFEVRLPSIEGAPAGWLPLLLVAPSGVVAVESECTEYLSGHPVEFPPAMDAFWQDRERNGWRREMLALKEGLHGYAHLDAARLIKQYMGLRLLLEAAGGERGREIPATLLYLYWEPLNAPRFDEFETHRHEVTAFSEAVAESDIAFRAMNYLDLWAAWSRGKAPPWLAMHLARLHRHYSFRI